MPFPESVRLELPILLELRATGGCDNPRYLYERLIQYFPQITAQELAEKTAAGRNRWQRVVQLAAQHLTNSGDIKRTSKGWALTPQGEQRIVSEDLIIVNEAPLETTISQLPTHRRVQEMLLEIGSILGRHAETEFEHYDVVWRDSFTSPRLSHVFEVQISGSVDSALTRLKQAYDAQRSKLFLVIANERDKKFADKRLIGSFHEIIDLVHVVGVGELQKLYNAIKAEQELLKKLTYLR